MKILARNLASVWIVCLTLISISKAGSVVENVDWANWTDSSNGQFTDSAINVNVTSTNGTTLINPNSQGSTTFTAWNRVAVSPVRNSNLGNLPTLSTEGFRIQSPGAYNFNIANPVDTIYLIVTSLGSPSVEQRIQITDNNDNPLEMTLVGLSTSASDDCVFDNASTVVSGNEANCVVKFILQNQSTFKVNILSDENYSVFNIGVPTGLSGQPTTIRSVPSTSVWSLMFLISIMAVIGIRRKD